jgi:hypothetical protein
VTGPLALAIGAVLYALAAPASSGVVVASGSGSASAVSAGSVASSASSGSVTAAARMAASGSASSPSSVAPSAVSPPAETAQTSPAPPPPAATPAAPPAAETAQTSLERARAAYEYGDMELVVESARAVADGRFHPTPAQRAQALRFLGIALYLTGRPEGAETAFFDLLRQRSSTRLDPTTTRPDVVAFFENVRARHYDEIRLASRSHPGKRFLLSFFPPAGQFQNGDPGRGWTMAALELVSLGVAIGTYAQLKSWVRDADQTFPGHTDDARTLKVLNNVAVGVLVGTLLVGIIDGVANFDRDSPDPPVAFVTPDGLGFRF